jgi:hypothetical protein
MFRSKALRVACLAVAVASFGACGGRAAIVPLSRNEAVPQPVALPSPSNAVPVYLAQLDHPVRHAALRKLKRAPGVVAVATVAVKKMAVEGPAGRHTLRVGTVEPLSFRSVSITSAKAASFVWTSLLASKAVVTFEAGKSLGLDGSQPISLPGAGSIGVGAFADPEVPNIADVLVNRSVGRRLHIDKPSLVVVGAKPGESLDALTASVKKRMPGARWRLLLPKIPGALLPTAPQATGEAQGSIIGTMHFLIKKNGFIRPDPAWVAANIASGTVPILGTVTCHRILFPQLSAALAEIERKGLSSLIDPGDYGGCYVPRFVDRNPDLPLSMHAFGLAIDINVSQNPLGTRGNMDPRIVAIFEKWGFKWGGDFRPRPDPMHFELQRLIHP